MSKIGPDEPADAASTPDVDAGPVVVALPADDADVVPGPLVDVDELASLVDAGAAVVGVLVNDPAPSG